SSKTIAVPILNYPGAGNKTFGLTLDSPAGGAALGSPASSTVTIIANGSSNHNSNGNNPNVVPNAIGPVINDMLLLSDGQAITQNAKPLTRAGVADTTGALRNAGLGGGPYVALFGLGTRLSYSDHNGDLASLSLSGGGMMELVRGANGDAQYLRIMNAVPGLT